MPTCSLWIEEVGVSWWEEQGSVRMHQVGPTQKTTWRKGVSATGTLDESTCLYQSASILANLLILPLFHLLIFPLHQLCPRERGCFSGPAACLPTSLATSLFPPLGEGLYMVVHTIRDTQENEEGCALKWGKVSHRMMAVCLPCGQDFRVACAAATEAGDLSNEVVQWEQRRMRDAQGDTMPEEVSQWEIMKV
ncbi:unnamed protein product [Taenia asiatica]|uniref:Uncharacterized protein n=1 Tax=Taenia asiatica TaxID=60517 RepID=A0A0R3WGL8_TAEAS|nr:unnamed protein product [Taenia asiatica]